MLIIVGPSACGKTRIANNLTKYNIKKIITYTTRPKRNNEINDIDYHFVDKKTFLKLIEEDYFFEYEIYNNEYYGTAKKDISKDSVLIVEPKGLITFKEKLDKVYSIFINVDKEIRKQRMIERLDNQEDIEKRLINDEIVFKDLNKIVDFTYNFKNETVEELTIKIYEIYKSNHLDNL